MGLGLASIRDIVSYFRKGQARRQRTAQSLTSGAVRRAIIFGASQSGRIIRDFIYEGLNESVRRRHCVRAALPVVTGSRRSFVNARFAQPAAIHASMRITGTMATSSLHVSDAD